MISFVALAPQHADAVAGLHLECLRTGFRGRPGRSLLRCYYASVACGKGATGIVALEDNAVIGFVCGVWNPQQVHSILLGQHGLELLFWGFMQIIWRPRIIREMLKRVLGPRKDPHPCGLAYELRPIAVAPEGRRSGVAAELIRLLLKDAAARGYECVHLYVEDDNDAAKGLYLKAGFNMVSKNQQSGLLLVLRARTGAAHS